MSVIRKFIMFLCRIFGIELKEENTPTVQQEVKPSLYMSEDVIAFLVQGHPEEEQARIRAYIKAQEAKAIYEYSFSTSRWYFEVKNGQFKSSNDPEKLKINRV